jgi:hypothetical protein
VELHRQQPSSHEAKLTRSNDHRAERAARLVRKLTPRQLNLPNGTTDGLLNKQARFADPAATMRHHKLKPPLP